MLLTAVHEQSVALYQTYCRGQIEIKGISTSFSNPHATVTQIVPIIHVAMSLPHKVESSYFGHRVPLALAAAVGASILPPY
jgi:hypothetical protein